MPKELPNPTPSELEILRILWRNGEQSVREVYGEIARRRDLGYTTVLKTLQVMNEKGLVSRDEEGKAHVYRAAFTEETTQRNLVLDLLERAFGGASQKLVLQALASKPATARELAEIRKFLDELDAKEGG